MFLSVDILFYIIILLLFFIILLIFFPKNEIILIKQLSLLFSCVIFILTLILWIFFNNELGNFVYVVHLPWLHFFNVYYSIGVDGISIFFIILTAFLTPICILIGWNSIKYKTKEYMIMLLLTELLLINVFAVLDLFFFMYFLKQF